MSNFYKLKTIDNEPGVSTEDVQTAINGETIEPANIVSDDIVTNFINARKLTRTLDDNNLLNPGSEIIFNQTLSSPSMQIDVDTNGDGSSNQTYSLLASETTGDFILYDTTLGSNILSYEKATQETTLNDNVGITSSDVQVESGATFLNNVAGLNTDSKVTIKSVSGDPGFSISSDTGAGVKEFAHKVQEADGKYAITGPGGNNMLEMQSDATVNIKINDMLQCNKTVSPRSALYPVTDQAAQLGLSSRRFLDIWSFFSNTSGSNPQVISVTSAGELIRSGSDERLKKNIADIPVDWTKFNLLKGRTYNFKTTAELASSGMSQTSSDDGTQTYCGFIAQEVETAGHSSCAITSGFDGIKSVDPWGLLALAVVHIKDLEARVAVLEAL